MGQFISSCDSYFLRSMLKRSECARELLTSFRGAIDLTTDGETRDEIGGIMDSAILLYMPASSKALSDVKYSLPMNRRMDFMKMIRSVNETCGMEATITDLPEPWRSMTLEALKSVPPHFRRFREER